MGEPKTGVNDRDPGEDRDVDPGAYIGNQPELEEETIPGGVTPRDERIAAYQSRPGVPGEPSESERTPDAGPGQG
jgi:hypothetical protein